MASRPLVFGVTLDQVDALDRLVRTIAANGDVIATGGTAHLDERSLPALGDAIYDAAHAVRDILDEVGEQKLAAAAATIAPGVPEGGRQAFPGEMRDRLLQARLIMRLAHAAAGRAGGPEDIAGACRAASEMVGKVIEYLEANFDASPEERERVG